MFCHTNNEPNLEDLDTFIKKPSQNIFMLLSEKECEAELKKGAELVVTVLEKNPQALITILESDPYIPSSDLFADLADKMNKINCLEELKILFEPALLDTTVDKCVWNVRELESLIKIMPTYADKIINDILNNEERIKRIFNSKDDSSEILKEIGEKYPHYKDAFTERYNQYFNPVIGKTSYT